MRTRNRSRISRVFGHRNFLSLSLPLSFFSPSAISTWLAIFTDKFTHKPNDLYSKLDSAQLSRVIWIIYVYLKYLNALYCGVCVKGKSLSRNATQSYSKSRHSRSRIAHTNFQLRSSSRGESREEGREHKRPREVSKTQSREGKGGERWSSAVKIRAIQGTVY